MLVDRWEGFAEEGGRRAWAIRAGTGDPTVLLEIGLGRGAEAWEAVIPGVARFARVCSHDRPGIGRSPAGPRFDSLADMSRWMRDLFVTIGAPGPYVFVGQSVGGVLGRVFAAAMPDEVAGVVMVDAANEGFHARLREILTPAQLADRDGPPPEMWEGLWAEVREAGALGARPLAVLARGRADTWPAHWPRDEVQAAWLEHQRELAALSTRGEMVVCPNSGHQIQEDEPGAVVDAIRRVVYAVRAGSAP